METAELEELQVGLEIEELELQLERLRPPLTVLDLFIAEYYIQKRGKYSTPKRRRELTAEARKEWLNMTPMAQMDYQNQPHVIQILVENEEREIRIRELEREIQAKREEIERFRQHLMMVETHRLQNEERIQLMVEKLMIALSLLLLCVYVFCSVGLRLYKSSKNQHF